jgi:hypothetical protein
MGSATGEFKTVSRDTVSAISIVGGTSLALQAGQIGLPASYSQK